MMAGAAWYGALAKPWMKAVGLTEEPTPNPKIYIVAMISQFMIAYVLAGLIGHIGSFTIWGGILSALFCWGGFTLAPMMTNHRFQGNGWDLTIIDAGYWFAAEKEEEAFYAGGASDEWIKALEPIAERVNQFQKSLSALARSSGALLKPSSILRLKSAVP
ncbi:hypothetical protein GQR58_004289 [Nymphon striatum]|nr:hypothetical protein GQR58_004289 [Nymphon striatum]